MGVLDGIVVGITLIVVGIGLEVAFINTDEISILSDKSMLFSLVSSTVLYVDISLVSASFVFELKELSV